ncbi:MAG: gamma carbonic anhydrase family protein [Candidatus Marinimicrobia bacterium]|nr:gamma carbonic anhydrase family protein [Candidatus Neomarinimicrobiota bacterium]MCF7921507.1 gamma carbonic anhydrase family protein [Candidatus Neomarinimicrobiota bacterium]
MMKKSFKGLSPKIHKDAWVAENAVIIGDVEIGPGSSIWYNVVIRGDLNKIRIGANVNVQDGAILHVESEEGPCLIGDRVTIGHQAIVHGCIVKDDALIGMGATVLSWARIDEGALVAAGALVKEYEHVPARTLWAGVPAKQRGVIDDDMFQRMQTGWIHYVELAESYRSEDDTLSDH